MFKVLLLALFGAVSAQAPIGRGNSAPISQLNAAVCSADPRTLVADQLSVCWYYQCIYGSGSNGYSLVPRRCALGTYVATNFVTGSHNPCTERFPIMGMYDCTRATTAASPCTNVLNCTNGATLQQQGSLCWCNCSLEYQGSPDCSVRRGTTPPAPTNLPCPNGAPLDTWCSKALPNGANPCQNGGNCTDQCTNFVCSCPVPFTKDKLCAAFDCAVAPNSCPTGQTCRRGINGKDEFYTCA